MKTFSLLAFALTCIASAGCDEKYIRETLPGVVPRGGGYDHVSMDPPGGGRLPGMFPVPFHAEPFSPIIPPGCSSPQSSPFVTSCTLVLPSPKLGPCDNPNTPFHVESCDLDLPMAANL